MLQFTNRVCTAVLHPAAASPTQRHQIAQHRNAAHKLQHEPACLCQLCRAKPTGKLLVGPFHTLTATAYSKSCRKHTWQSNQAHTVSRTGLDGAPAIKRPEIARRDAPRYAMRLWRIERIRIFIQAHQPAIQRINSSDTQQRSSIWVSLPTVALPAEAHASRLMLAVTCEKQMSLCSGSHC
jgi:hypothetical protein